MSSRTAYLIYTIILSMHFTTVEVIIYAIRIDNQFIIIIITKINVIAIIFIITIYIILKHHIRAFHVFVSSFFLLTVFFAMFLTFLTSTVIRALRFLAFFATSGRPAFFGHVPLLATIVALEIIFFILGLSLTLLFTAFPTKLHICAENRVLAHDRSVDYRFMRPLRQ